MSNGTIKIDGARFLLTLDPERRIIQDASILIEGQRITRVGKASELRGVEADRVIDATDMVVTPGLINTHLHISYASATSGMFPDSMDPGDYLADTFRMSLAMTEEVGNLNAASFHENPLVFPSRRSVHRLPIP